jgi:hypothetical protein
MQAAGPFLQLLLRHQRFSSADTSIAGIFEILALL